MSTIQGYSRKLLTIACYLPPNYPVAQGRVALEHIEGVVRELKGRYKNPFLVVGGDFNQWPVQDALQDFPDLREAEVGPTRKDRCIAAFSLTLDELSGRPEQYRHWSQSRDPRAQRATIK